MVPTAPGCVSTMTSAGLPGEAVASAKVRKRLGLAVGAGGGLGVAVGGWGVAVAGLTVAVGSLVAAADADDFVAVVLATATGVERVVVIVDPIAVAKPLHMEHNTMTPRIPKMICCHMGRCRNALHHWEIRVMQASFLISSHTHGMPAILATWVSR